VWVGVLQGIEFLPGGVIGRMALPTNQKFDERAVILQLSLAVKDFGRFWLKNTVTIYRRELRNSGRCRAQFGLEL